MNPWWTFTPGDILFFTTWLTLIALDIGTPNLSFWLSAPIALLAGRWLARIAIPWLRQRIAA